MSNFVFVFLTADRKLLIDPLPISRLKLDNYGLISRLVSPLLF